MIKEISEYKIYFVRMFDGFKEREARRVSNERRFTKSVFNVPCSDTSAKLGGVDTDG